MAKSKKVRVETVTAAPAESHHRAKDPVIVGRIQKVFKWAKTGGIVLFAALIIGALFFEFKDNWAIEKETAAKKSQIKEKEILGDSGWVRDPYESAVEVRRMMVYPNQSKVALIANEYRFDANCEGYAEIIIYGNPNPLPCNPEPGTKHLGDRLRTYNGWLTLEFVAKKPVQVIVRRWPKS